ncbi:MAG: MFS transporter [Burkholderiales bacterium]|nr:MFS transporter [Burkholderiales bacterium]
MTGRPGFPRGTALIFALACGLAVANVYYAQPLLEVMADEFGFSHASVGMIITVTQVGYGLGLLLIVPLGDLLDRRKLIAGQSALSALALAAAALAPSAAFLLVAMAMVGALAVVTQVMVAHAAVAAHPDERGRVVGLVTSGIVIGILLARTVAGALSDLAGWRTVYLTSACVTFGIALLLLRAMPRDQSTPARVRYTHLIGSVFRLFAEEPALRVRAVLAMLIFAAINILLNSLALALSAPPHSLSLTEIGLFGLAGAAGALGAAGAGRQADRGRAERTTGVALGIMLLSWLPTAMLPHSLWGLVVGVVLIDFGLQAVHVSSQSLIGRQRPEAQSRLTAGYMIFYSIGCGAGAIVSTFVYARSGWSGVCIAGAGVSLLAFVFWAATRSSMPQGAPGVR